MLGSCYKIIITCQKQRLKLSLQMLRFIKNIKSINHSRISLMHQENRKVFDSVYGFIKFPKEIWQFIDTPHFQRLRNIKQLGCLFWVFPGAVNTRFQHCLGTGHLAQKYITMLIQKHKDPSITRAVSEAYHKPSHKKGYKSIIDEAVFTVTLAGVLHDVGHGPYSHLFDSKVVHQVNGKHWEHEIASLCLIDAMYEDILAHKKGQQHAWLKSTKDRVKSLIIGKITKAKYKTLQNGDMVFDKDEQVDNLQPDMNQIFKRQLKIRPWEFQIVSNRLSGIDVDKLDYFRRDAYYVGAKNIYIDHQLLMSESLILEEKSSNMLQNSDKVESERYRICYPTKYSDKVYDIFYSRYKLYKTYYLNLKSNGVDFMIAEILKLSEPYLNLIGICSQVLQGKCDKYVRLTDSIIQKIDDDAEKANQRIKKGEKISAELEGVVKAGKIIEKLKRRQTYDFIREYHKCFTFAQIGSYYKIKKQLKQLIDEQLKRQNNIVLNISQIGFGIKDKNPFEQCRFYDKSKEVKQIDGEKQKHFSMLRPDNILELSLSLYLKDRKKNLTGKDIKQIQKIEKEIYQKIKNIDASFISGYSGTYTNRSHHGSKLEGEKDQLRESLRQNQIIDSQI